MNSGAWIDLPAALVASEDYKALNAEQRQNFVARLRYCDEIATKGADAATMLSVELLDIIDDIELDALSIMGSFSNVEATVSPYRVHSSWTFECERSAMAGYVPSDVADFLATASVSIGLSCEDAKAWLRGWAELLRLTVRRFGSSSSFTEAVTHLIVADALVSSYLVFAATVRLSDMLG